MTLLMQSYILIFDSLTDFFVLFFKVIISFFVIMPNLITTFIIKTDNLQFFLSYLRSFHFGFFNYFILQAYTKSHFIKFLF